MLVRTRHECRQTLFPPDEAPVSNSGLRARKSTLYILGTLPQIPSASASRATTQRYTMMHFSSSLSTHESTLGGLRRSVEQLVADGTKCRAENHSLVRFYLLDGQLCQPVCRSPNQP